MLLSFEKSRPGRSSDYLPDLPKESIDKTLSFLPENQVRQDAPRLPELAETDLTRHYQELENRTFGVNDGFYPLGSCTMKYNPKINDYIASLPGFSDIHPLQPAKTVQGALEAYHLLDSLLSKITGMDHMSFQPMAGAQGEFTALLMIRHYHRSKGDTKRNEIIIPDSAHGTNPASASMAGFEVVSVPSDAKGCVDLEALGDYVSDKTAGLMLTNPNTLGIFDPNIKEITRIIHEAGGLCYYDGANLNPILGLARPGDMGFDLVHLNLHKTFSTPHGGGGPGSGPIGCKEFLKDFLPADQIEDNAKGKFRFYTPEQSCGRVGTFHGNFLVSLRALAYILRLGKEGLAQVGKQATLNASYLRDGIKDILPPYFDEASMHEFVISLEDLKAKTSVTAKDFAKSLMDYGIHPPTMYFPLNVPEALMIEPTETESIEMLDRVIEVFHEIYQKALDDPDFVKEAPHTTPIRQADETRAARHTILRYDFKESTNTENG